MLVWATLPGGLSRHVRGWLWAASGVFLALSSVLRFAARRLGGVQDEWRQ
jgi:hypothetical protein